MALIQYRTTAAVQGDTFTVLIRKLGQKLGVPISAGDNVYRVMWKILDDLNWNFGVTQSHVNVATKLVAYDTRPFQGDTLNVLFLKFAQRTGYVINVRGGSGGLSAILTLNEILDPANPVMPSTSYTLTYANPIGNIVGTNPQTVVSGASGTPVTATTTLSYTFSQWSDGNTNNPRTDVNVSGDVNATAQWTAVEYVGDPYSDFEDVTVGASVNDQYDGEGWWAVWGIDGRSGVIGEDDFESYTPPASVSGVNSGTGFAGAWI